MRVGDRTRAQHLSADEAYQRFFDGYYNLGEPGEAFVGTLVMSPPSQRSVSARTPTRGHRQASRRRWRKLSR